MSISLKKVDGTISKFGFINGQRFSDSDKQYAVERKEYSRLLDFVYALKTGQVVLNNKVTFEPSEWAKPEIRKAIEDALVPKWNQISYTDNITRLEVCWLIDNYINVNKIQSHSDADANVNPQFTDTEDISVTFLWNNGIINGKSETLFCPYELLTREEFAEILSNTYHSIKSKATLDSNKIIYKDKDKISDWALESVSEMTSLGMFQGNENSKFEPQKNILKEEVILTLMRFSKLIN